MTARAYYVYGVELVGVEETCEACGKHRACGRSISGLAVCVKCARDFAAAADELALEVAR